VNRQRQLDYKFKPKKDGCSEEEWTLEERKWKSICNQRSDKEPFTKEKDEIIIQSVVDDMNSTSTGKRGIGLWESISKKIPNRSPDYINNRRYRVLSRNKRVILLLENINNKKSE